MEDMKKYTLFVGCPAYRWENKDTPTKKSLRELAEHPLIDSEFRAVIGDAHIERARSNLLAYYLQKEKPYDFYLQLDSDIEFVPHDIYRAMQRMEEFDVSCLGGPYSFKTRKGDKNGKAVMRIKEGCVPDENHLVEAWYVGGGFTLCTDKCIKDMTKKYRHLKFNLNPDMQPPNAVTYGLFNPVIIPRPDWGKGQNEMISEDYSFCHRVWKSGHNVKMDMTIQLKHWINGECYTLPSEVLEEKTKDDSETM